MPTPFATGAGAFGAGLGVGAGHDPADVPTVTPEQETITSLYFDPEASAYVFNDDFTLKVGSPSIQRAALLALPRGAIPSTADSGLNVTAIRRANQNQRRRVIEDELKVTWKSLLDSNVLLMGRVELSNTIPWDGVWYVALTDLTLGVRTILQGNS